VTVAELSNDDAEAVLGWLERNEFRLVKTVGGPSTPFGDRRDTWERDGALVRLTRDRGQWWYDMSRTGTNVWLDVDELSGAMGFKPTTPVERIEVAVATENDRVFDALGGTVRHSR
jgi:hypothetical protein